MGKLKINYKDNGFDKIVIIFQGMIVLDDVIDMEVKKRKNILKERHNKYQYYKQFNDYNIEANYLFVEDNFNSSVGWYILDDNKFIYQEIASQLEDYIKKLNINKKNIFLFGSSKGGFAAILYGILLGKIGGIISVCPQIDVVEYLENPPKKEDERKFSFLIKDIFSDKTKDEARMLIKNNINNLKTKLTIITSKKDDQYDLQKKLTNDLITKIELFGTHSNIFLENSEVILGHLNSNLTIPKKKIDKYSIIIPMYNNSYYLKNHALFSLKSSKYYNSFEIIIVDDGSDDFNKKELYKLNEENNKLFKILENKKGPSGSASVPRNIGVKNAENDNVIFLDPDDMLIPRTIDMIIDQHRLKNYDIVICQKKVNSSKTIIDYSYDNNLTPFENLVNNDFSPQSLAACIFSKKSILKNKIFQVEGGFGEDTLFFRQASYHAQNSKKINAPLYIYYDKIEGSAVNVCDIKYFEKSLLTKNEEKNFLNNEGIKELYYSKRKSLEYTNWYFPKYKQLKFEDQDKVIPLLKKMIFIEDFGLYENSLIEKLYYSKSVEEFNEILKDIMFMDRYNELTKKNEDLTAGIIMYENLGSEIEKKYDLSSYKALKKTYETNVNRKLVKLMLKWRKIK